MAPASAQVSLPSLPTLPGAGEVTGALPDVRGTADEALNTRALRDVRRNAVRDLLRRNRDTLEADPQGQPIVRSQILAIGANAEALSTLQGEGFQIVRTEALDGIGDMVTLRAPPRLSTRRALQRLREADPAGVYDFDHLHLESGQAPPAHEQMFASQESGGGSAVRIGLIDGGVGAHASLRGAIAAQRGFAGESAIASPHATAIASLLRSAAPGARLLVADIYGGAPTGGASSALARALTWLASENVGVINVSLVGPRNRIVETVIARLVARGVLVVAAVGNDGPAAAPLFPASYDGVVGVTGVDARQRVLIEAGRGPQVDFAAPGLPQAASGDGFARVRGTSYAAPIVAGLLAQRLAAPSPDGARRALQSIAVNARDLGARGRDTTYGDGLVGADIATAAR